jgi:CRISPR-associated protein Csd1
LRSPFAGATPAIDDNAFYALALSSNKSRLIVRNWLNVSLAEAKENLASYFERQQIVGREGEDAPVKLMALAGATVRDLKDRPPQVVPALMDNALTGTPLPFWLLQQAVARARAERENVKVMTRPRAALIKMVLLSQPHSEENIMPALNTDHPHPAYHCGRLLALLDDVQRNAVSARATLIDRYYGAASTTPATVFGALMRNAQNHLSKLRRLRPGLYIYFDRAIADVASHIEEFPTTLTLREQGLFALGFYQQKHRPRKEEAAEAVAGNGATEHAV